MLVAATCSVDVRARSNAPTVRTSYCEGNICALLAAKDHVNVFLYDGAIVPDPEGIITGGHENKSARTFSIRQDEHIKAPIRTGACSPD